MALNKRIDQLPTTSPANNDEIAVWDNSLNDTRKLTLAQIASFINAVPSGTTQKLYINNASGTVSNSLLIGATVLFVIRGGLAPDKIVTPPSSPLFNEILFDSGTGELTAGTPFVGENLTIIYTSSQLMDAIGYVVVDNIAKLPTPVSGVITLAGNTTYFFTTEIDLAGDRLVCGQNTTIIGGSSENSIIKSTGLIGTALISSSWSLPIRFISLEADVVFNLDANGNANQALDWLGVNVINSNTIGAIANYTNFIASDCGFLNSKGLTFNGSIGTIGFSQSIFDCMTGGTMITIPSTATVTRRFRIIYSAFVILGGETGINVSSSASIPVEGYILDTDNFSGGGTYTTGVTYTDNKALFTNNKGISNSSELSYYTMNGNATATVIGSIGVPVKIAGTTTSQPITQKFTNTNNRATYTGAISRSFYITSVISCTSGNNNQIGIYISKNGSILPETETYITTGGTGRAELGKVHGIVELNTNDYIEIFVENATAATNITVTDLSTILNTTN